MCWMWKHFCKDWEFWTLLQGLQYKVFHKGEFLMAASCRGVCTRFDEAIVATALKYESGYKRCSFCGIFLKTDFIRCPCCNLILRTRSRVNPKRRSRKND